VHLKRQHGEAGDEPIANYAKRVSKVWVQDVGRAQAFMSNNPDRCTLVHYKKLHAEPHQCVARILEHWDVSADEESVSTCVDAGLFQNLTKGRERGQEDPNSQFRKGIVGDWQHALNQEAKVNINKESGDALVALGYTKNSDWVNNGG
jgi:hypothetical protein